MSLNNLAAQEYQKQSERDNANGAAGVDESPPTLLPQHAPCRDHFGRERPAAIAADRRRFGEARLAVWACNERHQSQPAAADCRRGFLPYHVHNAAAKVSCRAL